MAHHLIGIDPGLTGGVVVLTPDGALVDLCVVPVLDDHLDAAALHRWLARFDDALVAVELVHAMPGQGVTSMFSFGETCGRILAVVQVLGLIPVRPTPQRWQKALAVSLPKDHAQDDKAGRRKLVKARALAKAAELLGWEAARLIPPKCRVPHEGLVDAALIAEWLRLDQGGAPRSCPWST